MFVPLLAYLPVALLLVHFPLFARTKAMKALNKVAPTRATPRSPRPSRHPRDPACPSAPWFAACVPQVNRTEPRLFLKSQKLIDDTSPEGGLIRRSVRTGRVQIARTASCVLRWSSGPPLPVVRPPDGVFLVAVPCRAQAAHENGWEAFAMFSVALLSAYVSGVDKEYAGLLALVHVVARLMFNIVYLYGVRSWPGDRSGRRCHACAFRFPPRSTTCSMAACAPCRTWSALRPHSRCTTPQPVSNLSIPGVGVCKRLTRGMQLRTPTRERFMGGCLVRGSRTPVALLRSPAAVHGDAST